MALQFCGKHGTDTSNFCFVNKSGIHIPPRQCLCTGFAPDVEDRKLKFWPEYEDALLGKDAPEAVRISARLQRVITPAYYKREMVKKYGKENPLCPIEDEHSPISKRWST